MDGPPSEQGLPWKPISLASRVARSMIDKQNRAAKRCAQGAHLPTWRPTWEPTCFAPKHRRILGMASGGMKYNSCPKFFVDKTVT